MLLAMKEYGAKERKQSMKKTRIKTMKHQQKQARRFFAERRATAIC
jgi:hypothetical protein